MFADGAQFEHGAVLGGERIKHNATWRNAIAGWQSRRTARGIGIRPLGAEGEAISVSHWRHGAAVLQCEFEAGKRSRAAIRSARFGAVKRSSDDGAAAAARGPPDAASFQARRQVTEQDGQPSDAQHFQHRIG